MSSTEEAVPLLEARNLAKSFGSTRALQGVDLSLLRGEILGLLGPNGSGKSTLLRTLCGLVRSDEGEVLWEGIPSRYPHLEVRRSSGILIERPPLFTYLNAMETMQLSARYSGGKLTTAEAGELLEQVGLSAKRRDPVSTYSQGMKQRLGVAMVLVNQPDLLILDEPFNGLDPVGVRSMRKLLTELSNAKGITILLSSHQLHEIEFLCERVVLMEQGKVRMVGALSSLNEASPIRYLLESSCIDRAITVVGDRRCETFGSRELVVWLRRDEVPEFIAELVQAGVSIYRLAPQHRLEDLFEQLGEGKDSESR